MIDLAPYLGLLAALAGIVVLSARNGRLRRDLAQAQAARQAALGSEQTATRLLRLAAQELRGIGMTLHGHADRLAVPGQDIDAALHSVGLAAASSQVLGLADELQDHTMPDIGAHGLREELLDPAEVLESAVVAAALALEPGRRQWRVELPTPGLRVWADRRVLRHVLGRVMADAARNTRHDDSIDLSAGLHSEGLCLIVEDEGMGLANPEPGMPPPRDSRGIGLRLALARALMLAHGGRLEVQAAARVGTRVCLIFPATRLRDATGQPVSGHAMLVSG